MIRVSVKKILNEKKMSMYALSKATGISPNNLNKLIKNETNSIKFDTLEKICTALECDIIDILKIVK
ncbi:hypothetical protein CLOHAE12215_01327 [Clostridium haemolyticum]|uniref:Transcription regulator n=1 Tax=Clostridium botulinum D str. 1873 TaxID=592027 RepID=A0A9P2G5F6_CLOBO|nr:MULTISPECIES: helix-turn-helix transcriptional regulator [Clostridium]EES90331.1 transcription regulator [Clostridium phage D-1873]MCD3245257.1 helix-turn-helix transcriptional regulator [Clostridium botulinum C]MCD3261636.1 helix-turn-helix transcriptional regulator [Clostridium botulinum C]QPW56492.1 helix-turn-helix transcriptional regulator [Clostridium botulinum]CAG7839911.1 hypothetical protein CLOHAE12215_01327 [Clostridium haemolyticum]